MFTCFSTFSLYEYNTKNDVPDDPSDLFGDFLGACGSLAHHFWTLQDLYLIF